MSGKKEGIGSGEGKYFPELILSIRKCIGSFEKRAKKEGSKFNKVVSVQEITDWTIGGEGGGNVYIYLCYCVWFAWNSYLASWLALIAFPSRVQTPSISIWRTEAGGAELYEEELGVPGGTILFQLLTKTVSLSLSLIENAKEEGEKHRSD